MQPFDSAFLEEQRVKEWLRLVDGPMEFLRITVNGIVEGIGEIEQIFRVKNEFIVCGSDITDEQLSRLEDCGTLVLNSLKITEKGVKERLKKWLELPLISGNVFEIRFKPSSPDFDKNRIFMGLDRAEIEWKRYFQFAMKYTQKSGKINEFDGFYFVSDQEFHSIKIMIPSDFKPKLHIPNL